MPAYLNGSDVEPGNRVFTFDGALSCGGEFGDMHFDHDSCWKCRSDS